MSRDLFNEWYKNRFGQFSEQPPAEVWDNISEELDLEEVWTQVDARLASSARYALLRRRAARTIAALLIIGFSGVLLHSVFFKPGDKVTAGNGHSSSGPFDALHKVKYFASENRQPADHAERTPEGPGKPGAVATNGRSSNSSGTLASGKRATAKASYTVTPSASIIANVTVDELPMLAAALNTTREHPAIGNEARELPDPGNPVVIYKPTSHGLSTGPYSAMNNTWLLNRTTLAGLRKNALYHTGLTFRSALGFSAVHDLKGKWGVQADAFITEQAQNYHYYDEGFYTKKVTEIGYYRMNVLLRSRKTTRFFSTGLPASRVLLIGGNVKKLKTSEVYVNRPAKIPVVSYSSFDYGLQAGYEYELQVHRSVMLAAGVSADIGLNNINPSKTGQPRSEGTYNAAIGANLGVRFIIPD